MKWITHQTGAILGALALNVPVAAVVMCVPGAILPDLIDLKLAAAGRGGRHSRKAFNQIHRGSSHWFGWWLALWLLVLSVPMPALAQDALAGAALGAFSHVLMDMLNPKGVPLLPFGRRGMVSAPVCSTGASGEYALLACMIAAGLFALGLKISALLELS